MFDQFHSRLLITGQVILETPLRIGAGRATEPIGTDLPVVRDARGRPYIPGSSLKGVLRSRVEALVRVVGDDPRYACDPTDENRRCILRGAVKDKGWKYPDPPLYPIGINDLSKGLENDKQRTTKLAERVVRHSCLVCNVFGSTWLASHVLIRDLSVASLWLGQFAVRDGVAIDRDTETAADKKKYDYEVVPTGTQFALKIVAENLREDWMRGALLAGLAQFDGGHLTLGGGRSRGLGQVRLEFDVHKWEGREGLLDQLEGKNGTLVGDDEKSKWRAAFADKLRAVLQEVHRAQATAQ